MVEISFVQEAFKIARFDAIADRVADAIRDDQRIGRVLVQKFAGLGIECEALRIPDDLIDTDDSSFVRLQTRGIAQADQEYVRAVDARWIDRAAEGDAQARLQI